MKKVKSKQANKPVTQKDAEIVGKQPVGEDEMLDDYSFLDWSKAERGKYTKRYAEGTNVVLIAPDLLDVFPDAESVNQALRALADIIRASSERAKTS